MALNPGFRLGPYEIQSPLGAGGMGEVYKARDTRLDRVVAIKVLPGHVAADPQLRERFEREAKAISSLNHPHICALFDVGSQEGIDFLVMEYLDGETLAERLARERLPLDVALPIATQMADALDKAHRAGIVHRDLKPGNIMLTRAGAKLLDFGLAKAGAPLGAIAGASALPTTPASLTAHGTILGTIQYMAPEQLEGVEADRRTDIFAFGAVLYEMLTGRKAFDGKSQASVIAAIMHSDPTPLSTLQPILPVALERAVHACLAKDPDDRWQSARDLLRELQWIAEHGAHASTSAPSGRQTSRRLVVVAWGVAVVMTAAAAVAATLLLLRPTTPGPVTRFVVQMPPTHDLFTGGGAAPALSADGTTLVYVGTSTTGGRSLYRRRLDQLDAIAVQGPDAGVREPTLSPDGQWLAFYSDAGSVQRVQKVSLAGGPVTTVTEAGGRGMVWQDDRTLVMSSETDTGRQLFRVSAGGGTPTAVTSAGAAPRVSYLYPHMVPDSTVLAFTVWSGSLDSARVAVRSLDSGEERVLVDGTNPRLLPTGHLLYVRQNAIWAVPFDAGRLQTVGEPRRVVENVQVNSGGMALFAVSGNGMLAYVPGAAGTQRRLAWVDRQGRETSIDAPQRAYDSARLSPDGTKVVLDINDGRNSDIWIWDDARSALGRLTADPAEDQFPEWTPDGRRIVFTSARSGSMSLFWQPADGTGDAEVLVDDPSARQLYSFAPDRTRLVVAGIDGANLSVLTLGESRRTTRLLKAGTGPLDAAIAPNGSWIAYQSNESGRPEIYVSPFPSVNDSRSQVSRGGGLAPVWSRSGEELFYVAPDGGLLSVSVSTKPGFVAGEVKRVFADRYIMGGFGRRNYDVSPDGQRFLVIKESGSHIVVVQNWFEELKRLVPTK
ncbi:MAG TPA: protein kinase [Vicinamibacterales bacterium]|nr:protein kinase [Vicinamibacterales bacterium]